MNKLDETFETFNLKKALKEEYEKAFRKIWKKGTIKGGIQNYQPIDPWGQLILDECEVYYKGVRIK